MCICTSQNKPVCLPNSSQWLHQVHCCLSPSHATPPNTFTMRSLALMQANSTATTTPQWATPPTTCWCRHSNAQRAAEAVRRAQPSSLTAAASVKRNPSSTAQLAAAAATCLLLACPGPSFAHIAIDQLPQPNQQQQQQSLGEFGVRQQPPAPSLAAGFDPSAVGQIRGKEKT